MTLRAFPVISCYVRIPARTSPDERYIVNAEFTLAEKISMIY
jgi:hypothetical protein